MENLKIKMYLVNNGKIIFEGSDDCEVIDAQGKMLIPGFIDIHIHGAVWTDFKTGTAEAIDAINGIYREAWYQHHCLQLQVLFRRNKFIIQQRRWMRK